MATYIAMIRGINVSGHNSISMDRLRDLFTGLGYGDVRTYIQSGNVLFDASGGAAKMVAAIEAALAKELGSAITAVLRSPAELGKVLKQNPFLKVNGVDLSQLYVTFLNSVPSAAALKAVAGINAGGDELNVIGREVYVLCRNGYGRTKLSNTAIEKVLALKGTTRNWKTVTKLHGLGTE
ncbi:MAG: DUF1697 domain-containing protein [Xanthobacteraceae bacterium]